MRDGDFHYAGGELDLFAEARRWRAYWTDMVRPFIGEAVLEVGAGIGSATQVICRPDARSWQLFARLAETLDAPGMRGVEARCDTLADLSAGESFDTALYIDVMKHIEADLGEMARLLPHLRPGGHVVVLGPKHPFLLTPFDVAIGHVRRYHRPSMGSLTLPGLRLVSLRYLDSVGMAASLGNRLVLRAAKPTRGQIALWDGRMVPLSRRLDALLRYTLGKSILGVWRRVAAPA
ncbi:hypothetical protein [Falsiroseomonas sp. HW251]|uniref:hypothetical protein n=1 Tax=Falsiroseomonas sp. HW251 TaxID=3390998 RepID=UPI003D31D479